MIWKFTHPNYISKTFLYFLVLYSSVSKAQEYFPLVDTSSVWMEGIGYDGGAPPYGEIEQYTIQDDTIFNGISYKKLYYQVQTFSTHIYYGSEWVEYSITSGPVFLNTLLSEEIEEKKIYLLKYSLYDTTEVLLYNFNLNIGDTLSFGSIWQENVVTMIDSVVIGSFFRKRFHIAPANDVSHVFVTLIEGIGSSFGLIAELETPFESFENLYCFTNNGETTVNFYEADPQPADSTSFCDFYEPTIVIEDVQQKYIHLFPNPVSDLLYLDFPPDMTSSQIYIYNSSNQLKIKYDHQSPNTITINTSQLTPGFYFVIFQNDQENHFGKFLKL